MLGFSLLDAGFGLAALIALAAGVLSFLSPCVLPVVPPYLAYMGGISIGDLTGKSGQRRSVAVPALFFVLGLSTVFLFMGFAASALGRVFLQYQPVLTKLSGAMVIVLGLHFLHVLRIPMLDREARIDAGNRGGSSFGAYVLGLAFAFGWTPCIGPQLGAILSLAASEASLARGTALLAIYAIGLGIPFLIAALFVSAGNDGTGTVRAIERFNNQVYAAGDFTTSGATTVNHIARFNETTKLWESVGGADGTIYSLKVYNGALYAGGSMTTVGGVVTGGFARYNGTSWSNAWSSFSAVTRWQAPTIGSTLGPSSPSWMGGMTRSNSRGLMRGSCNCTTSVLPFDQSRTPIDSGSEARPQPIQMSGQGGVSASDAVVRVARGAGVRPAGSHDQGVRTAMRLVVSMIGTRRAIASASPTAWASMPARPSVTVQTLSGSAI